MQDNSMDLPIDSFSGFAVQDSFTHALVRDKRMFGFHTENLNIALVERVLKPNSTYLIRHTATANNSIAIVDGIFYEGNGLS